MNQLPFSQACENNKAPILAVLTSVLAESRQVLEIGSGTGQHAVYFGRHLPHVVWQPTEQASELLTGIELWRQQEGLSNVSPPQVLDVTSGVWPVGYDAVFSANTVHIMGWPAVEQLFAGIGQVLPTHGLFCLYGPFNYQGVYTSDSNARFDLWLKQRDAASGIRDFEALCDLAGAAGLVLEADHAMPANNRLLVWRKARG